MITGSRRDVIARFQQAVEPFRVSWDVIHLRAVVDVPPKRVLTVIGCLMPGAPQHEEFVDPVEGVAFVRTNLEIAKLDGFLSNWERGIVELAGTEYSTELTSDPVVQEMVAPYSDFQDSWPDVAAFGQYRLEVIGGRRLEEGIHPRDPWRIADAQGFRSFNDLCWHRLRINLGDSYPMRIALHAPILASVVAERRDGALRIAVETPRSMEPASFRVTYRLQDRRGDPVTPAGKLGLLEVPISRTGIAILRETTLPLPDATVTGEVHLYHEDYVRGTRPLVGFVATDLSSQQQPTVDHAVRTGTSQPTPADIASNPHEPKEAAPPPVAPQHAIVLSSGTLSSTVVPSEPNGRGVVEKPPAVDSPYFSDNELGPRPRTIEEIPTVVWNGLVALLRRYAADASFAQAFPATCEDGGGQVVEIDSAAMGYAAQAAVPGLTWPLTFGDPPETIVILDLLVFCHASVASPIRGSFHPYLRHHHYTFETEPGQEKFRDEVNALFARNGVAFRLDPDGRVRRTGPPVASDALTRAIFKTGDSTLDALLEDARRRFFAPDPRMRRDSLEKLWDAFERLKTVEPGANKAVSAKALLDKVTAEPTFRSVLDDEARELTSVGNDFMIRHHETNKIPIGSDSEVDYLFHRLFALIWLALKASGRT